MSAPRNIKTGLDINSTSEAYGEKEIKIFIAQELAKGNAAFDFATKLHKTYLTHLDCNLESLIPDKQTRIDKLDYIWKDCLKVAIMYPQIWKTAEMNQELQRSSELFISENVVEQFTTAIEESFASKKSEQLEQLMQICSPLCEPVYTLDTLVDLVGTSGDPISTSGAPISTSGDLISTCGDLVGASGDPIYTAPNPLQSNIRDENVDTVETTMNDSSLRNSPSPYHDMSISQISTMSQDYDSANQDLGCDDETVNVYCDPADEIVEDKEDVDNSSEIEEVANSSDVYEDDEFATLLEANTSTCYCQYCKLLSNIDEMWDQFEGRGWIDVFFQQILNNSYDQEEGLLNEDEFENIE